MADSSDTKMTDPQSLVDAALGTTAAAPAPVAPAPVVPEPTPEPTPEPIVAPPLPTPEPVAAPAPAAPSVAIGDDTPLAFMAAPAAAIPADAPAPPVVPPAPEQPAYMSPPPVIPTTAPEKKGKGGKVVAAMVGFFLLVGGIVGGFYYYQQNYGESAQIAAIGDLTQDQCSGCTRGGRLVWRNGRCVHTGTCEGETAGTPDPTTATSNSQCESRAGTWCESIDSTGRPYAFCIADTNTRGCNNEARDRGYVISTGSTYSAGACTTSGKKQCTCGNNQTFCFDVANGYCGDETGISDQTRMTGLCAITPQPLYTWADPNCTDINNTACRAVNVGTDSTLNALAQNDGIADWFNQNGLKKTGVRNVYFCENKFDDLISGCSTVANVNLSCFCGTIQIDYGNGFESRTMRCGCPTSRPNPTPRPSPSPSPSPSRSPSPSPSQSPGAPTMACIGITKAPATGAIAIGDTLTFTCSGSVTPPTAGTLSYKFRYSINNGTMTALTNKTPTTAELTIAACGNYKVECQACATLNGVLTCKPTWTGATQ